MNVHNLTETEASYLLFAIKRTLRDRSGLTPGMEQFYDSTFDALATKLERCRTGTPQTETRYRHAQVRPPWKDVALRGIKKDSSTDPGKI